MDHEPMPVNQVVLDQRLDQLAAPDDLEVLAGPLLIPVTCPSWVSSTSSPSSRYRSRPGPRT
jgi:hypothetical protein